MPINFVFRSYDGYLSSVREKFSFLTKKLHQILIKNSNFCEFFENEKVQKISKFRIS